MSSGIQNWIKLRPSFLHPYIFTCEYLYIDKPDYLLDTILDDYPISWAKFNKYEGSHPDYPDFRVCMIRCFRWEAAQLENAFRKLDWKLTLTHGKKYTDFKDFLFNALNNAINAE